jgi:hypothetical protein
MTSSKFYGGERGGEETTCFHILVYASTVFPNLRQILRITKNGNFHYTDKPEMGMAHKKRSENNNMGCDV